MTTIELSESTFEHSITGNDIVLVDWWASWCGPCRMFAPVFERAAAANIGQVRALDMDEVHRAVAEQHAFISS